MKIMFLLVRLFTSLWHCHFGITKLDVLVMINDAMYGYIFTLNNYSIVATSTELENFVL
jgi:hypothetical protein